ncbi:MAG TPA: hypothetical protein VLV83_19220 [Acidobacteriota bacterium]|nr:hypothetical protein [Acidobacteriota bacterium]
MAEHPRYDHERSDTHLRPLVIFGAGLLALTVAAMLAMWGFFVYLQDRAVEQYPEPSPLAETFERPAAPQLQSDPARDLEMLLRQEQTILESYGWVDSVENIVRIPIDRAIKVVAEKQLLPYRQEQGPAVAAPDPTEDGSEGREGENP